MSNRLTRKEILDLFDLSQFPGVDPEHVVGAAAANPAFAEARRRAREEVERYERRPFTPEQIRHRLDGATRYDRAAVIAEVDAQLASFEQRHGMTTAEMRRRVVEGELAETDEVLGWLMVHNRRRDLEAT